MGSKVFTSLVRSNQSTQNVEMKLHVLGRAKKANSPEAAPKNKFTDALAQAKSSYTEAKPGVRTLSDIMNGRSKA